MVYLAATVYVRVPWDSDPGTHYLRALADTRPQLGDTVCVASVTGIGTLYFTTTR